MPTSSPWRPWRCTPTTATTTSPRGRTSPSSPSRAPPAGYGEDPRPVALDLAASFWARESGAAHAAAYVLGYGAKQYGGPQSLHLRAAHVHPRGAGLCAALLLRPLAPSNLCAGYDGAGACSGDSGGPLVFAHAGEFVQAGVVSWGTGDCTDPGVYSLVAAARAFLAAAAPEARAAAYEPVADPCACSCDSNGFAAATHCDCGVHASHGGEPAEPFCYVRGPECPAARHAAGPASLLGAVTRACDLAPPAPPAAAAARRRDGAARRDHRPRARRSRPRGRGRARGEREPGVSAQAHGLNVFLGDKKQCGHECLRRWRGYGHTLFA